MMKDEDFSKWVKSKIGLSGRSLKDVVSRAKRVSNFVDLSLKISDVALLSRLEKHSEFSKLPLTVKSQLRRALRLFRQFKAE